MKPISKVEKWNDIASPILPGQYRSALSWVFSSAESVFSAVWLPVKYVTNQGIDENWSYINVGLDGDAMANLYATQYGANYLSEYINDTMDNVTLIEQTSKVRQKVASIISKNEAKYMKMIELQGYTYNPLWNVDGVETTTTTYGQHITDNKIGKKKLTDTIAEQTNTNDYAERINTDDIASQTNTDEYGENVLTDEFDNHTDTVKHFETTMDDTTTERLKTKDETENVARTDTHTTDQKTDTHTIGGHTDTHTLGAHFDTYKLGAHTDTHEHDESTDTITSKEHTDTVTYERHGNIGVTKTQELIESERANLRFNLIQELFDDINEYILVGIYEF